MNINFPSAGGGDVVGPASVTSNSIAVWDGAGGNTLKDSLTAIDPTTGMVTLSLAGASVTHLRLENGAGFSIYLKSTNISGDVNLEAPDASGTLALQEVVTKVASGNYTIGTTNPRECYGGIITVDAAATLTIPAVVAGMHFTVVTKGAVAVSVDPNASDKLYLEGVALDDGDKVTNLSTSGDTATFYALDATGFMVITNGWTDGGP